MVRNMFNVNNKNTLTLSSVVFIVNFEHILQLFSSTSIVDFEWLNVASVSPKRLETLRLWIFPFFHDLTKYYTATNQGQI